MCIWHANLVCAYGFCTAASWARGTLTVLPRHRVGLCHRIRELSQIEEPLLLPLRLERLRGECLASDVPLRLQMGCGEREAVRVVYTEEEK